MKSIYYMLFAATLFVSCSNSEENNKVEESAEVPQWHTIAPEEIDGNFIQSLSEGMLLSSGVEGDMNTMAIGWGAIGMLWKRPTITVYVSGARHTHSLLERNDYFTVCRFDSVYNDKVIYMGSHSGRDTDKVAGSGLTLKFTELGHPYYDEANLMIECKMLYKGILNSEMAPEDIRPMYENNIPHTMYVGEIVNVLSK